ncbi:MAG TPA: feruloyl-CoA synthase [Bryobacteraceae bacterium]|nr:feruloyl-CoA synthase [Bryobacteraceae bacterium]
MTPATTRRYLSAPVRRVEFPPADVDYWTTKNGGLVVRPKFPLGPYADKLTDRLDHWAGLTPDRVFLAERDQKGEWRKATYAQMRASARNVAEALLARPLSAERPIAILSGNDLEHAALALGAMYAGIPFAPISPAYSLISSDFGKLKLIFDILTPGLVFVSAGAPFRKAIEAVLPSDAELVTSGDSAGLKSTPFWELERTVATSAVDRAHAAVGPDTIAKFLFTSGSTGTPKGVINTHRMLCSNQEIVRTMLPFVIDEPPVLCDWLPWNHTFAGNHDFGLVLYNGGSYYIDDGRPVAGAIDATIRNLDEVQPTIYLNVPRGFEMVLPFLRDRRDFRDRFYSRLRLMYYAGAGLSQPVWDELQELAVESCGERILMFTGLGSTETGPSAMFPYWEEERAGHVGLPAPGVELKLVKAGEKNEARLRSPSISPGYWRQPELTRAAFDDEGYYCLGDALQFVDPGDPGKGFIFDGRISEDFKLATGTWVSVGPLRAKFLAHCAPYLRDIVFAGHDGDYVAALIFPNVEACRTLVAGGSDLEVVRSERVRAKFMGLLRELARASTGSSTRVARAMLMEEPPSIDKHEVTDKGSFNQGAVLRNRAELVKELYAPEASARTIVI